MSPGPADEARRALREAREREGAAARGLAGGEGGSGAPGVEVPRVPGSDATEDAEASGSGSATTPKSAWARTPAPASSSAPDVAEAAEVPVAPEAPERGEPRPGDAARAALRRAASAGPSAPPSEAPEPEDEEPASEAAPQEREGDRAGARPGDVAREALRAARARAFEARAEAERRPRRTASARPRADAPRRATGVQARDLREFLADAFRMPSSADEPDELTEPYDSDETARTISSPAPRTSTPSEAGRPQPATGHPRLPAEGAHEAHEGYEGYEGYEASEPGAAPHRPRSMAAPGRDGELRRTFPAFPSHASASASASTSAPTSPADSNFAATWWGNAWVTALEEGALDAKRLARGRSYAEQGNVDAITVTPGLVLAYVQGSRPRPYRVQVRLRTLGDADWTRFLDAAAERPGHIAALLDKELPHSLADCGVPLLPGPRDLDPHCSCPDRGRPCKHAAALCYQTARLLDADPFVLLLLRGRGERELLDALSRLSAARAARAAREQEPASLPGVRATDVLAPRRLPPLPPPLPVPPHPEQPPVYPAAPGGPDPFALDQLATEAAARAHALLGTGRDPVGELTLWQDAVRLAAARPGSGLTAGSRALYASLASAADRSPAELARAVAAWRQGGLEGLAVLEEPWDPPAGRFDRARPLLLAADLPAFRPWHNHLTHPRGHVQLRLGRDGLWYAYESEPGHDDWWPRGTPDLDPVGALTGLGASPED
ncbi:SWIM zinc finger family protein [Streptomyces sp. VMFN-G11Ma]|uniref:SWIM zinc finger family protein n=1 Tax=Streptomyces sp. VMFN-G11Ma TaxID=2135609 RepID=UPI000D344A94|nr:SWIM zinc finger family protein [Streptomyces sp. VMFN-G11Ma]